MPLLADKAFGFDGFVLDLRRGCLRSGDREIGLRPKSFAVLRHLVENAGRLVPRDELIETVWPNRVVTDESLSRCISDVRTALGDSEHRIIRTVQRRGYLLTAPVSPSEGGQPSASVVATRPGPPRLSIVVLPLVNLGGGAAQDCFVDGITEDLTTELSRRPGAFVIARTSALSYRGKLVDVRQVGRELGVRYVLAGSVRRAGDRVRVAAQLIDAESGAHLWAHRFDWKLTDLFELQDAIVLQLVGAINARLLETESDRSECAPAPEPLDLVARPCAA